MKKKMNEKDRKIKRLKDAIFEAERFIERAKKALEEEQEYVPLSHPEFVCTPSKKFFGIK